MLDILYVTLSTLAVLSACYVALSNNTVYCALSLVVTMLCLAGIYLVIQAPFVALIQVLVYAGAIMVLFLYVIMLLNPRQAEPIVASVIVRRFWARLLFLLLFFLISAWLWLIYSPAKAQTQWESVPVKTIATRLLTDFLLPFELTSVLLLVAIVGAVLIARRN